MPIAVGMNGVVPNGGPISPTSPIGPNGSGAGGRMTKAAFFRARSPPIMDQRMNAGHSPNDQLKQFDLQTRLDPFNMSGRHTPDSSEGSHTRPRGEDREELLLPQVGGSVEGGYSSSVGASLGHTPLLESSRPTLPKPSATGSSKQPGQVDSGLRSPEPPRGLLAGYRGALAATNGERFDSSSYDDHSDEDRGIGGSGTSHLSESAVMGIAGGSDEMLMTLLAGQAAVDCEKLPVGGWEEVDSWKKELALLSNRLESLVARHQREIKILTAARTLQKLNNANKRMSKQTTESLEQSEKRADAAEKEVLVLRDRESALRRRLMEHWSGVMAWEVRRLERVSTENQLRFDRQAKKIASSKAREEEMMRRIAALEDECAKRTTRTDELEEMVIEMGRRERAVEEELKELDGLKTHHERERQAWKEERQALQSDTSQRDHDRKAFDEERQNWAMEKKMLIQDREMVVRDRANALENARMSDRDRAMLERVRGGLGGILGRKAEIAETEMVDAVEEVKMLLQKREDEVVRLKEEMREVNAGLEDELRRASADRDQMKKKVDEVTKSDSMRSVELSSLQRQLRAQTDQLSDLKLRNESLSTSLAAAQMAVSAMDSTSDSTKSLQRQVDSLTAELDSIAGQFNDIWCDLPQASTRVEAGLIDSRTGQPNKSFSIPSTPVNVEALQRVYQPHEEQFSSIAEMISRVGGMVDDGRIIVERCANLGKERDLLKTNAARAKKLAEDSRRGLETYQQQVAVLEDRLANTGASESRFLDELNSLRTALDAASSSKRQLETQIRKSEETVDRLQQANDILSAKTLSMAEDAENARETLQRKVQDELSEMKRKLEEAQEEADEGRTRGQAQRIQLLDELNSLQAENADMRKQLRAAQRGPAK